MVKRTIRGSCILSLLLLGLAACTAPQEVDPLIYGDDGGRGEMPVHDGSLRIAALDYYMEDLSDPDEVARYARADLLIVSTAQFWKWDYDLSALRAANPNQKIVAYFRTKCVRTEWADEEPGTWGRELYDVAKPYLAYTTAGDTISDWPGTVIYDFTQPAVREAMVEVFARYQRTSPHKFDGVFWDYFAPKLWIAPTVDNMIGEPDMDGDGIPHWDDEDELQAFLAGEEAFVDEMRRVMGPDFIQIANGVRAARDSTFAGKFDGLFYENFPDLGFSGAPEFQMALDPAVPNNLWAAHDWPLTRNGGPWLIVSNMHHMGGWVDGEGQYHVTNPNDLNRIVALLTDATAITYSDFGLRDAGIPAIEYSLGPALSGVDITGATIARDFERGRVELYMGSGDYPLPFEYRVWQDGQLIDALLRDEDGQ